MQQTIFSYGALPTVTVCKSKEQEKTLKFAVQSITTGDIFVMICGAIKFTDRSKVTVFIYITVWHKEVL